MLRFLLAVGLLLIAGFGYAQQITIDGYVFEENNRGFLKEVRVKVFTKQRMEVGFGTTDTDGHFVITVPKHDAYIVRATKKLFIEKEVVLSGNDATDANKLFAKIEMEREPGYIFDVTLAEPRPEPDAPTNAIEEATIEIYNNTTDTMELVLVEYPNPNFQFTLQQGNHYTIMISKEKYLTKQIEAYVNVKGCIVCIDGVNNLRPGVVDNLTAGHQKGTLLANIEMRPTKAGSKIPIENLYYDSGKWEVTKDMHQNLNDLITLLKNNPALIVDLQSHTDSRGDDQLNYTLSGKRAKAAVQYIMDNSDIPEYRIVAKGMGETTLVNGCKNGVKCTEAEHAKNRRTELVITGFLALKEKTKTPLSDLKEKARVENLLDEVLTSDVIQITDDGDIPDDLRKLIEAEKKAEMELAEKANKELEEKVIKNPVKESMPENETNKEQINTEIQGVDATESSDSQPAADEMIFDELDEGAEDEEAMARAKEVFRDNPAKLEADKEKIQMAPKEKEIQQAVKTEMIVPERDLTDIDLAKQIKELDDNYSGYVIELYRSSYELPASHRIFTTYKDVKMKHLSNGDYAYYYGDFMTKSIANDACEFTKIKFDKSRVVKFRDGKFVKME